jgi:hypothetical protein
MIRFLPLFAGLVPVIGVSVAYWLNVRTGVLPACMPLLDGCTSISATGRYMPGSMPFRAVLLPHAVVLVVLWWLNVEWLRNAVSISNTCRRVILYCGSVGAAALVLYVTFLGSKQPFYEFMRHFGIYFYFLGTVIAQISISVAMPGSRLRTAMLAVTATPFVLGIINLLQKLILHQPNNIQNSIEWTAALLMQFWFVLLYVVWRNERLTVAVRADPHSGSD